MANLLSLAPEIKGHIASFLPDWIEKEELLFLVSGVSSFTYELSNDRRRRNTLQGRATSMTMLLPGREAVLGDVAGFRVLHTLEIHQDALGQDPRKRATRLPRSLKQIIVHCRDFNAQDNDHFEMMCFLYDCCNTITKPQLPSIDSLVVCNVASIEAHEAIRVANSIGYRGWKLPLRRSAARGHVTLTLRY